MEKPTHLIRNCENKYSCTQTWDSLNKKKGLSVKKVRICSVCEQPVWCCYSDTEISHFIQSNFVIAIPVEIAESYKLQKRFVVKSIPFDKE